MLVMIDSLCINASLSLANVSNSVSLAPLSAKSTASISFFTVSWRSILFIPANLETNSALIFASSASASAEFCG